VATAFNTAIQSCPQNIVAKMFGFEHLTLFATSMATGDVPVVNFE
jgi:hypothetical protein